MGQLAITAREDRRVSPARHLAIFVGGPERDDRFAAIETPEDAKSHAPRFDGHAPLLERLAAESVIAPSYRLDAPPLIEVPDLDAIAYQDGQTARRPSGEVIWNWPKVPQASGPPAMSSPSGV